MPVKTTLTIEQVSAENARLLTLLETKSSYIQTLQNQIYLLRHARFGRKTEKDVVAEQLSLQFDEADDSDFEQEELTTEADSDSTEVSTYTRKKKGHGRKPLPKTLPFIEKTYDLTEPEKQCSCGCLLSHIGDVRSEQLDVVPQMTFRIVHIRKKYACKGCEETIVTAKSPQQPLPKSMASAGLLAAVIDSKFNRHTPLYRQEDMFKRAGMPVTRSTLSRWLIKSADLLKPLVDLLQQSIIQHDIAFADETTLQVLNEDNRPSTSKSYMWLFIGAPPDKCAFVYQYHATRAARIAVDFFNEFIGYLHADCYRAYINLGAGKNITHVACMAHARRYFVDVTRLTRKKKGLAHKVVDKIAGLYKIEKELKSAHATATQIAKLRQKKSAPILAELKIFLNDNIIKVPPQGPLAKAVKYMLNHFDALSHYLKDGRLEIDNNRAERSIKPFVIGRKNWLFHGSTAGAHAGATLFSLIETCKHHNIDVFSWLKYALDNIQHADTDEKRTLLLPFNVSKQQLAEARSMPQLTFPDKNTND